MSSKDNILVGRVINHHGLRGWLTIKSYCSPPENIFSYQDLLVEEGNQLVNLSIEKFSIEKNLKIKFLHHNTREDNDSLIKKDIFIQRSQMPILGENEFYWGDLISLNVYTDSGKEIGVISDIFETGANDVLVVSGEKDVLVPYKIDESVLSVDLKNNRMIIDETYITDEKS